MFTFKRQQQCYAGWMPVRSIDKKLLKQPRNSFDLPLGKHLGTFSHVLSQVFLGVLN